jgi:hypothetical protein
MCAKCGFINKKAGAESISHEEKKKKADLSFPCRSVFFRFAAGEMKNLIFLLLKYSPVKWKGLDSLGKGFHEHETQTTSRHTTNGPVLCLNFNQFHSYQSYVSTYLYDGIALINEAGQYRYYLG